jgi:hypothetical protein
LATETFDAPLVKKDFAPFQAGDHMLWEPMGCQALHALVGGVISGYFLDCLPEQGYGVCRARTEGTVGPHLIEDQVTCGTLQDLGGSLVGWVALPTFPRFGAFRLG